MYQVISKHKLITIISKQIVGLREAYRRKESSNIKIHSVTLSAQAPHSTSVSLAFYYVHIARSHEYRSHQPLCCTPLIRYLWLCDARYCTLIRRSTAPSSSKVHRLAQRVHPRSGQPRSIVLTMVPIVIDEKLICWRCVAAAGSFSYPGVYTQQRPGSGVTLHETSQRVGTVVHQTSFHSSPPAPSGEVFFALVYSPSSKFY